MLSGFEIKTALKTRSKDIHNKGMVTSSYKSNQQQFSTMYSCTRN